jgi:DNA-directed RNA polymerase sigma subunit (sigma70/sigma32)
MTKKSGLPADLRKSGPGTAGLNIDRDKAIFGRRLQGHSLEDIGIEFGISGERVRQICTSQERDAERHNRRFKQLSKLRAAFQRGDANSR